MCVYMGILMYMIMLTYANTESLDRLLKSKSI